MCSPEDLCISRHLLQRCPDCEGMRAFQKGVLFHWWLRYVNTKCRQRHRSKCSFFLFSIFDNLSPSVTLFYKDELLYKSWICDYDGICVVFANLTLRDAIWQPLLLEALGDALPGNQFSAPSHTDRLYCAPRWSLARRGARIAFRVVNILWVHGASCVVNINLVYLIYNKCFSFCSNISFFMIIPSARYSCWF